MPRTLLLLPAIALLALSQREDTHPSLRVIAFPLAVLFLFAAFG